MDPWHKTGCVLYAAELAESIGELREKVFHCYTCFNITDQDPCHICRDVKRDRSVICVVENPYEIIPILKSGYYNGLLHVLHNAFRPFQLTIDDIRIFGF